MYRLIEEMYRMIRRKITYTSTNFKFFSFPQHPGVSVVKCQQAWYFYTFTSYCAALSSSACFSPLFLMKKWQVRVISLRMCPTTVKQLFRCIAMAYLLCSLSSSQNVSNDSRKDSICACTHDGHAHCIHY